MTSFRELEQRVVDAGGLLQVSMEELRDMTGAGKLGTDVREQIRSELQRWGLRVLGRRIPKDQAQMVWLIATREPNGELLVELLRLMGDAA